MTSEQLQLLIAGYVLGDLNANEAKEFEQLLATNPAIVREVAAMQQALELSYAPPEVSPPRKLRSQVLAAYQATPSPRLVASVAFLPIRAIGAFAAALIVALGFSNYHFWRMQVKQAQVQQSEILTYSLQPKNASLSSATVEVNASKLEARLKAENLPALPPDKVYVLWTVLKKGAPFTTDQKNAILTEVFGVDAKGNVSKQITIPVVYRTKNAISAIAVTTEDAAAPQNHAGAPILIVKL